MDIRKKRIYVEDGLYHLVIADVLPDKKGEPFVYTSLSQNIDDLFVVTDLGLEHPRDSWKFIREATDEEFIQTLKSFVKMLESDPHLHADSSYFMEQISNSSPKK